MSIRLLLPLGLFSISLVFVRPMLGQSTAFTYQGRLTDAGVPATATYDFQFTIFDALSAGATVAGPLQMTNVGVTNGLFTVALDFGATPFNGNDRWLEIAVRPAGAGAFTNLTPRQKFTSTPYAIRAANFSGGVLDSQLSANVARLNAASQTFSGAVQFTNPASIFDGTFNGQGSGVTNIFLSNVRSSGAITPHPGFAFTTNVSTVATNPIWVISADVNGDGRLDLISANQGANSVSILTNNGNGSFSLASTVGVGTSPIAVAAADLNGDGRIDLICANNGSASISIITNNGTGIFSVMTTATVGVGPLSLAIADFNLDGRPDVACVANDDSLTILTNDGTGAMILLSSTSTASGPVSIVSADFNNDGRPDLAIALQFSTSTVVLTNNGSGAFTLRSSVSFTLPRSIATADFNLDGRADLVIANINGGIEVVTNNGTGAFAVSSVSSLGTTVLSVATGDLNGDGRPDVITANNATNSITVLTNNGGGGAGIFATLGVGDFPTCVIAADLNSDGRNDLVTANNHTNTLTVLLRNLSFDFQGNFSGDGSSLTGLSAANISAGTLSDSRLSGNVPLLNGTQSFTGTNTFSDPGNSFSGNGAGLTALNASNLTSGDVPATALNNAWKISGNAGTTAGTHFIGTTDNQPLEFRIGNVRVLRLEDNGDSSDTGTTPDGAPNIIAGSPGNFIASTVVGSTISGGGATNYFNAASTNRVEADYATVAGGLLQLIQTSSRFATISGGDANTIETNAHESTISGGGGQRIRFNADSATIAGGRLNVIEVNGDFANIGGGILNKIGTNSGYSVIGGGETNGILAESTRAVVAGGSYNYIGTNSDNAVISGGNSNNILNNAQFAVIPGGQNNVATNFALAAGRRAKAVHTGSFVWGDSTDADFSSTATNQFLIRASGGVGIGVTNPTAKLQIGGVAGVDGIRFPDGTLQVSAPPTIIRSNTIVLDLPSIAAGSSTTASAGGFTGTTTNSVVVVCPTTDLGNGLIINYARVSSPGVIMFRVQNVSAAAIDPPPMPFAVAVFP